MSAVLHGGDLMPSRWKIADWRTEAWCEIPAEAGVYVIYVNGHLLYIGSSCNLKKRLNTRRINFATGGPYEIKTPWGWADSVKVKYSKSKKFGDWLMREVRLIRRIRPEDNRTQIGVPHG
jgi:excinuclease UvrABC nuclease subunit